MTGMGVTCQIPVRPAWNGQFGSYWRLSRDSGGHAEEEEDGDWIARLGRND
jgi:hypothetical protein